MSSNKQSMKLYTEEEVRKAIELARDTHPEGRGYMQREEYDYSMDEVIDLLTPIELPSDEEIWVMSGKYTEKCGLKNFFDEDVIKKHWVQAYKSAIKDFQINKIQGANNK